MSFWRGVSDVIVPAFGTLGGIGLLYAVQTTLNDSSEADIAEKMQGTIVRFSDRGPNRSGANRYGLEYPIVSFSSVRGRKGSRLKGVLPKSSL